jgi:hypothetical protein
MLGAITQYRMSCKEVEGEDCMNSILQIYWNLVFNLTGLDVSFDVKYNDWSFYLVEVKADYQGVKEILAKRHLVPGEIAPGETRLQIVACHMRSVQISGAYNEVSIQVPVISLDDSPSDKFAHLYLPVSTEAARWPGVDIYGFPKSLAKIDFTKTENQIACQVTENEEPILEFRVDDQVGTKRQIRWEFYGNRKQRVVKTAFDLEGLILEEETIGRAKLVLGKHAIAETLKGLLLSNEVVRTMIGHELTGILRKPVPIQLSSLGQYSV